MGEPVRVTVEPDTRRFAGMLRVVARHLLAAADDIAAIDADTDKDTMADTPSPEQRSVRPPILRYFSFEHLTRADLRDVSAACHDLAYGMCNAVPDGTELRVGLRKLLEAKDCFVRAALDNDQEQRNV
jgi:hypothetical protein